MLEKRRKRTQQQWGHRFTPVQMILVFYLIALTISSALLALPIAHKEHATFSAMDIVFTAVSALSVTGLSTVEISETFSTVGIIFLAIIMQFGMFGIMAMGTLIWMFLGKKIGLRERRLIMTDQNQTKFSGIVRLMKQILILLISIQLIAFLVIGTYFLSYFSTAKEAYYHGFFLTVSAISNSGFDITGNSMMSYHNNYFIQIVIMLLIVVGSIGFPVLIEVKDYLLAKREERKHMRFSLFTKVTTLTFFVLIIVGAIVIFLLDFAAYFSDKQLVESFFYALFQSVTTKSAGLATLDVSLLTEENQLFMSLLMFIGASPSSSGGGIRTTTLALVIIFMITYIRGGKSVRLFKREIYEEDLVKAVTVTLMAIIMILISVFIILVIEPFSLNQVLFEVTSAFGTTGLSLGITPELSHTSKIILMILMFIGRVGIITFLFIFNSNRAEPKYRYPKEKMIIG